MWDVVILGGGPSGAASAISLRQTFPSLRVLMVEASDYSRTRAGEVLPPIARGLLEHLGVLSKMTGVGSAARGLACAWGETRVRETSYFYGLAGEGWHLERNRFDAMLATQAKELGAEVQLRTSMHFAERSGEGWHLSVSGGKRVEARWVIDATGRSAVFSRKQGARRIVRDSLTAFSRVFACDGVAEARTLVEACSMGWWYTAPLPGVRRVVSLLTDADLGRRARLATEQCWLQELERSEHVRSLVDHGTLLPGALIRSAATAALDRVVGDRWIATGDAAAAFDPLSAQGMTSAMRSGILAGFTVGDVLIKRKTTAVQRYTAIARVQQGSFVRTHRAHYAEEQRWSDQPFWMRRHSVPVADESLAMQGAA
jgi:flavin-dependent dehydrogenase